MTDLETFDDALNASIDALAVGRRIPELLAQHPRHAEALRPLLESALATQTHAVTSHVPIPSRLGDNYVIVRAAVERAQLAEENFAPGRRSAPTPPWWKRRLASMTLPLGAIALVALAGAGSAGASVATGGDGGISAIAHLPSNVVDSVQAVNPFSNNGVADGDHPSAAATRTPANDSTGTASNDGKPPESNDGGATTLNRPTDVTVTGNISDTRGASFTLTSGSAAWHVNFDASTTISGAIADGAIATVHGIVTATKNLHANSIDAGAPAATQDVPTDTPNVNETPGARPTDTAQSDKTTAPSGDHTPAAGDKTPQSDKTRPGADQTPGPPPDHTPLGQAGGGDGSSGGNVKP